MAHGITDTAATMAIKAHLRRGSPTLIALASNDALSANFENLARVSSKPSVYFVPMKQDDPEGKPYSLVAELEMIPECITAMREGKQLRPLFL
jgi:dipicolinate synthase subunit B